MRFSVEPFPGDSGFDQWHDAMKMVARLPGGIPKEFRRKLWLTLAEKHVQLRNVDWVQVHRVCFNDKSNPDDDDLGVQIVKDLHRTGCSLFCGQDAEHNQALLKRVLLAYARWNKAVGYCQGFNMLAAIILEVMERNEEDALKVMIYLIEGVLPESYFANSLRGLSVDMAVFRDLLRMRLPLLSRHLEHLQSETRDSTSGTSYEPPLTNVFTMQWFLTLFSNCLPKSTVLRVWDLIFLEGNEVLLRTALAIWDGLADRIMTVESADEFYSIMGVLTREMLEFGLMDANHLVKTICGMAPFPFPQLGELRDKYTYNITPFTAAVGVAKRGLRLFYSDDEDEAEEDQLAVAAWCFASVFPPQLSPNKAKEIMGKRPSPTAGMYSLPNMGPSSFAQLGPGGPLSPNVNPPSIGTSLTSPRYSFDPDRLSLDISALKQQYAKIRQRQKQAHVIMSAASTRQQLCGQPAPSPIPQPVALNHLLLGKTPLVSKKCRPNLMIMVPRAKTIKTSASKKVEDEKSSSRRSSSEGSKIERDENSGDDTRLSTSESGETLHWKDAKKERSSKCKVETGCDDVACTLAVNDEDDTEDDEVKSSSTSTELCDDDLATELDDQATAGNFPPTAKWEPALSNIIQPEDSDEEDAIKSENRSAVGSGSSSSSAHKAGVSSSESSTSQSPKNDQKMPLSWIGMQQEATNNSSGHSSTSSSSPTPKTSGIMCEERESPVDDLDDLKEAVAKLSLQRKNNDRKRTKQPKSSTSSSSSSPTSPLPNDVFVPAASSPGDSLLLRTIPVTTTFLMLSSSSNAQVKGSSSNGSQQDCRNDTDNAKSDCKKVSKQQQLTGKTFQFNPFPTPRKSSQIWSPSEVGLKLGLYETPPNAASKGPRGRKRNPKNS